MEVKGPSPNFALIWFSDDFRENKSWLIRLNLEVKFRDDF